MRKSKPNPEFSSEKTARRFIQQRLGIKRLNQQQCQAIAAGVQRHNQRYARQRDTLCPQYGLAHLPDKWGRILGVRWGIEALIREHYRGASSRWVGGRNTYTILAGKPAIQGVAEKVWHHKHSWSGTNLYVRVTIPPSWWREVQRQGLAVVDGHLVLSAKRLPDVGDAQVWDAVWAVQGRGLAIHAVGGWIARIGGMTGRSTKSPTAAIAVAKRELKRAVVKRLEGRPEIRHSQRAVAV